MIQTTHRPRNCSPKSQWKTSESNSAAIQEFLAKKMLTIAPFFAAYGLLVSGYIVSRFAISLFYRPAKPAGIEPGLLQRGADEVDQFRSLFNLHR